MKLFRVTLKSADKWDTKKGTLYVIHSDKKGAEEYVNRTKKNGYEISNVCYLGHELAAHMFCK